MFVLGFPGFCLEQFTFTGDVGEAGVVWHERQRHVGALQAGSFQNFFPKLREI